MSGLQERDSLGRKEQESEKKVSQPVQDEVCKRLPPPLVLGFDSGSKSINDRGMEPGKEEGLDPR